MGLVTAKEVANATNLDKYGFFGTFVAWILLRVTKISNMNRRYDKMSHLNGTDFLDAVLEEYEIDYEIPVNDLKRLPKEGAFITVSNHPLGGMDGIILLKLMLQHRPQYKVIANFLLQRFKPLASYIFPVNPFEDHKEAKSSMAGFKSAMLHLKEGHPVGIFPAGEVSTFKEGKLVVDRPWEPTAMKLIRKAQVPVVPIYFHARNSKLFYRLAKISGVFRTAKLPSEVYSQRNRPIKVRIGQPISVATQNEQESLEEFTELIRRKTYILSNIYEKERLIDQIPTTLKLPKQPRQIVQPVRADLIEAEIAKLIENDRRMVQSKNYEVFLAPADEMPYALQEIGRQREITFREIGEGTNNSIDIDEFDSYYHHMFLWDNEARVIAGAYRMGLGSEIFAKYGIDGFYLQDLFRFEPELFGMMSQSIEMGRAYIVKEYQQKPMPLFLLWKGIVHTTLRYPEHKYLIGGVSISNQFSNFSKSLMIEFMKSNYWDPYVAQYVRPKKEFKVKLKDADKEFVFDETQADLNKFDKLIDEVEPGSLRLPVLIKKYIKQNAKVVAFNVDPLFNNAVDGLMYIKISDLPESTVKPVMEEFQAELERKFMEAQQNS
ncbi:lysophospholipid acyltransferase family protein [Zobellia galactanivorans]|uniref:Phospholipid/glycerol Acyltransferase / hemolysin fusion n=1 Tax=Zobellia galactanivorans (strain DSM 12802 / CCUG 47099 / CIP 106680 / NCIMB 13871 / Dsij) TaxID=63186 RepID=G0L5H1_ZOBGA|nr:MULTISPECIES: lysophospholipid acyltransferase family protein [Zobellia]MDO6810101.1 lysophospholipid acyltransferase family protein [Zobellia galactanivorans]OWW27144.1 glycerol acyltransferase [Zobellia sp. OII3]CAZ96278.1 Phospholipid/glycerol Acyltransferase / hemolysin fusion [Zobellia galactanivorans]